MRNLTLSAGWDNFYLFDDYEAEAIDCDDDRIPGDLRRKLSAWNAQYRGEVRFSEHPTPAVAALDAAGRALAAELKAVFPDAQIRYASDGHDEAKNLGKVV